MDSSLILNIKDLCLYYEFTPLDSTNVFVNVNLKTIEVKPSDYFEKKKGNSGIQEDFELSQKIYHKTPDVNMNLMKIIDGVTLPVHKNENISIIGESGCGKTTLLLSLLNFPNDSLKYKAGLIQYNFNNQMINILDLNESQMSQLRGLHFGLIPQLARESINPWLKLGLQTGEILSERLLEKQEIVREKVIEYLGKVAVPDPNIKINKYVHQLSGGEAQKLVIAMALIGRPHILLADEILSSLDTISQGQVIELLKSLKQDLSFQFLFATHNILAACNMSDTIAVMYAGEIVEITSVSKFITDPLHPYSQGLLRAMPWYADKHKLELDWIKGDSPSPDRWPPGCRFSPRCPKAFSKCNKEKPFYVQVSNSIVACWLYN